MTIRTIVRNIKSYIMRDHDLVERVTQISRRLDSLTEIVKYTHSISAVPPVCGIKRVSQLANARLLSRVARNLEANNISYWLFFGTLLGAVRHNGSVPWDDDVDIGVMRNDYNKVKSILTEIFENEDDVLIVCSDAMRVMVSGTSCQVDIFPFDLFSVSDTSSAALEKLCEAYKEEEKFYKYDFRKLLTRERTILNASEEEVSLRAQKLASLSSGRYRYLMVGAESRPTKIFPFPYEWFFPLRKLPYEGEEYSVPNMYENILLVWYGDYMAFPKLLTSHSDIASRYNVEAYNAMKQMLQKQ